MTRAQAQARLLVQKLKAQGAKVLLSPAIRTEALPLSKNGRGYLRKLSQFDCVLLTSVNAVDILVKYWKSFQPKEKWPAQALVYAIGEKTAESLKKARVPVHAVAKEFVSESLLQLLGKIQGKKVLIPRAKQGREVLLEGLRRKGAQVVLWPLYQTILQPLKAQVKKDLIQGKVNIVAFTSASCVKGFMKNLTRSHIKSIFQKSQAASIGPVTSQSLKSYGVTPHFQAQKSTIEGMVNAVVLKNT